MGRDDIFEYAKRQYGTEPEYLWRRYPNYAVLRHRDNAKWYGIVMDVAGEKAGLSSKEKVDILEMKCDPVWIGALLGEEGFFPAYHMNKGSWIGVRLDGTVESNAVCRLLDRSYERTGAKTGRKGRKG